MQNHFNDFPPISVCSHPLSVVYYSKSSSELFFKPKAAKSTWSPKAFKVQKTFAHENILNVHVVVSYQIMKRTLQRLKCCIRERKQHESGVWEI